MHFEYKTQEYFLVSRWYVWLPGIKPLLMHSN